MGSGITVGARTQTLAALAALAFTDCSYAVVEGPPASRTTHLVPACTESRLPPALDTLFVLVGAYQVAVRPKDEVLEDLVIIAGSLWLGVFGTSAYYGFSKTAACSAARRQFAEHPPTPTARSVPIEPIPVGGEGQPCRQQSDCQPDPS